MGIECGHGGVWERTNPMPHSSIFYNANRAHTRAHFTSKFVLCIRGSPGLGTLNGNGDLMGTGQELHHGSVNEKQPRWE